MGEALQLVEAISLASRGESAAAWELATAMSAEASDDLTVTRALVAASFTRYLDGYFLDSIVLAERAIAVAGPSDSTEARLLAYSMRMFASAGAPWAGEQPDADYFALTWSMRAELDCLDVEARMIAGHLLSEGALATGRLSEAMEVLVALGDIRSERRPDDEQRVPFPPFLMVQTARVMLFLGEMPEALPISQAATAQSVALGSDSNTALCESFTALIHAHLDNRAAARAFIASCTRRVPEPVGLIETGTWIVCAYAWFAMGERSKAAECVVIAGGTDELDNLQVADRALGYEILVADALDRGDLDAAESWGKHSLSLAAHPAATVIVEQLLARIDDARGQSSDAAERAGVSAARARLTGRYLDAARADMVRARALAASGLQDTAVQQLTGLAHDADRVGILGIRRSAARELRLLGRRLAPSPGAGWSSLSERERQIAVLAAEGFSNQVIGATLFLSGRTVQSYMSRILAALGISSRAALPRHVAALHLGSPRDDLPALTPRQWEVATLVAEGLSNHELAERLDISVKTAEKHIGEILQRWQVTSRTSIANLVVAETMRSAG